MKYRWNIAPAQPAVVADLAGQLGISRLLAQCLLNRDLMDPGKAAAFLDPRLKHLADPFLLPDMGKAVERLFIARERQEAIVVFGDYDVDGVSSTALLYEVLSRLGWTVHYYLPSRIDEGYGLSQDAVENCLARFPVTLLLAVDCGSTTVSSVAFLRDRGVDVIVLDHHQVSTPAPDAVALVNPFIAVQRGTVQGIPPFGELCSVGLAFKLAHAVVKRGREAGLEGAEDFDLRPLLDLVALGTIADIVPLTGENRILVSAGLNRLCSTQRPGLVALKQVSQCPLSLGVTEVGFQLAPRLNASGRLETAEGSLKLLLAQTLAEALCLAHELDGQNRERQKIERAILDEAVEVVRSKFKPESDYVIVEGQEPWHIGVVGIVASRILQQFYRPTIIIGGDGATWRGSGRSVAGFDLAAALRECNDLLVRHGGHAMAAGLSVKPDNVEALRSRLNNLAARALTPDLLQPPLRLDAEVTLGELTLESVTALERLRPQGQGNPSVQLCSRGLTHRGPVRRMGAQDQHVKMIVSDGAAQSEAVWWSAGQQALPEGRFDLAFAPTINDYNGRRMVQLKVVDWQRSAAG